MYGYEIDKTKNGSGRILNFYMTRSRGGGLDMKRRTIHQWRNWLLEYIGDDKYELIQKDTQSVFRTVVAKNAMDAENECQRIIKSIKENPDGQNIHGINEK
jgi:hypothetical protein